MSSSAPADRGGGGALGAVAVLVGAVCYRAALAVGGVDGAGFFIDGLLAVVLLFLGVRRPGRAAVVGVGIGVCSALDVFFALRFGGPLTPNQLAWAGGASAALLGHEGALAIAAAVVVVVAAVACVRVAPAVIAAIAAVVVVVGLALPGTLAHHPLVALLPSSTSPSTASTSTLPFATPLPQPPPSWTTPPPWPRTKTPKHVVLFVSESTASRFVTPETMPRLTTLAREHGVSFTQHVAESPISIKSIFALLCGLHPDPTTSLETTSLPRIDCQSLPERLKAAGFATALVHGGYFAFTDKTAFLGERGFDVLEDGESLRAQCPPGSPHGWHNGWGIDDRCAVDAALAWQDERNPSAPSLLVVISLIPHHEYFLPDGVVPALGSASLKDRYRSALRYADDVFGSIVDGYAARGLVDDTVFVFVGDHGEAFDEHPKNRLHGNFLYDENVRAPLFVIAPGFITNAPNAPNASLSSMSSMTPSTQADVAPTVLDLLGLPPSPAMQGRALFKPTTSIAAQPLFTAVPTVKVGMRTPTAKAIIDVDAGTTAVYDLTRDPTEQHPLAVVDDQGAALIARARDFLAHQPALLRALPQKEERTYLARAAAAAHVSIAERKVMNMARPCVPLLTSTSTPVTLRFAALRPFVARVGVGIDDGSRFKKTGPVTVTITSTTTTTSSTTTAVALDDGFLSSSQVVTLPAQTSTLTLTTPPTPQPTQLCVWLVPSADVP